MNRRERLSIITILKTEDLSACLDAIQTIRERGGRHTTRLLLKATKVRDWQVRTAAIRALGEVGNVMALMRLLVYAKRDTLIVQQEAVDAIGKIGHPMVVPNLIKMLRDPNCQVRMNVARALGQIGDKRAIPALIEALHDENRTVVDWASNALAQFGSAALPELLNTLTTPNYAQHEEGAALVRKAAEVHNRPDLLQIDTRYDRNAGVRAAAGRALAAMGEVALPSLVALLQNPERHIQKSALNAIADMGIPAAIPALQDMLRHEDARFRVKAVSGLGGIDDPSVVLLLRGMCEDNHAEVREYVVCSLGNHARSGNGDAIDGLIAMFHDSLPDLRILAIEQLPATPTPQIIAGLVTCLDDNSEGDNSGVAVGSVALSVLERIGGIEALKAIDAWRQGQNPS